MSRLDSVLARTDRSGECWLFLGSRDPGGYGNVRIGGRRGATVKVHRWVFEQMVGPIPEGMHLDHLCRIRHCVNPAHLEPVLPFENWRRGDAPSRLNLMKTHCPAGHPYDKPNTGHGRGCSVCKRERHRDYMRLWRRGRAS